MMLTPIPQATKSCLSQPNKLSFNRPPYGRFILGLASLMTGFAEAIYLPNYPTKERRQEMITQQRALSIVRTAVANGTLNRAGQCEICTKKPIDHKTRSIVAHHFNGYDDPLNVWWVCRSCNGLLDRHDGSLNLEQAKRYIKKRQLAKLGYLSIEEVRTRVTL